MNRRDLFKGILGTAAAPPVVKAAGTPQKFAYCEICQAHHTPSLKCLPPLTDKQKEVWAALRHPDIQMVLFSGGRGRGATFLAQQWALAISSPQKHNLLLLPSEARRPEWDPYLKARWSVIAGFPDSRGWGPFDNLVIEDAHSWDRRELNDFLSLWKWDAGKILFTATPGGPGGPFLHQMFPDTGRRHNPERYHVNAALRDNPFL